MKLIRFGNRGREYPGVEIDGIRFNCSKFFKDWDQEFFEKDGLVNLQRVLESETMDQVRDTERWANPISRPGMVLCVGLNYSDHAKESGMAPPEEPVLFMKAANTVQGPFDPVSIPKNSTKTDWEIELGIVIGKNVLYLKDEAAGLDAIAGYTIVNDLSERHFQLERGGQWVKGKSCPGFTPLGPYLVTKDEVGDVLKLSMTLMVDDKVMQSGNTDKMIFNPGYIVWYASQFMKLEAGDLITTGTPSGVGLGMKPPQYLKGGETLTLEIEGLGSQKHYVKHAP